MFTSVDNSTLLTKNLQEQINFIIMKSYLDWAATALPDGESLATAHNSYINHYANPSSIYCMGEEVKKVLEDCRSRFAKIINAEPAHIYFCGSGTEANNLFISSLLLTQTPGSILISAMEHDSVWKPVQSLKKVGWKIIEVPIPKNGIHDPDFFCSYIDDETHAVFLMALSNENGAVQPIEEIANRITVINKERKRKIRLHVDCVQALGKIPLDMKKCNIDSASFSSHKIGAIRGAGALYLKKEIAPIYLGGGQEKGIRSGTENLGAIESFVFAAQKWVGKIQENAKHAAFLKEMIVNRLVAAACVLLPYCEKEELLNPDCFSPYIVQFSLPKLPTEVSIRLLSDNGVYLSGGSACSNNSKEKLSRLSKALKIKPNEISSSLRLSFGPTTTQKEIEHFCFVLEDRLLPLAKRF